jgi:hypothetical protein
MNLFCCIFSNVLNCYYGTHRHKIYYEPQQINTPPEFFISNFSQICSFGRINFQNIYGMCKKDIYLLNNSFCSALLVPFKGANPTQGSFYITKNLIKNGTKCTQLTIFPWCGIPYRSKIVYTKYY